MRPQTLHIVARDFRDPNMDPRFRGDDEKNQQAQSFPPPVNPPNFGTGMAKHHDSITQDLNAFILRQPMFFVATAAQDGRVNLSPKGLRGCFHILDPKRIAFLNLTGSGNETAAHLRVNNRITVMMCSFDAQPLILRLYGTGTAFHRRHSQWTELDRLFPDYPAKRQIVVMDVTEIITSCGFGVPMMDLVGQRTALPDWAERKGEDGIRQYWQEKNALSFDGQPTGVLDED